VLNEFPLQRLSEFGAPSTDDLAALDSIAGPPLAFGRQAIIRQQGEPPEHVYMLLEGWVSSAVTLRSGERQIAKVHLPGDLMGMPSICLQEAADSLVALTPAMVRKVPTAKLARLFTSSGRFAARMFLSAQRERLALMDRLVAIGAKPAAGRLAAALIDLHERLALIGQVRDHEFALRMTQDELGDYLGLTAVHVNRTFRQLEDRGLISRRLQRIRLLDPAGLRSLSGYVTRALDPACASLFEHGPPPRSRDNRGQ
jgi:CRP-like cAMP-binding protein